MQIKLIEDMFRSGTYELDVTKDSLVLTGIESGPLRIPFGELLHFNMEGSGAKPYHFVLETRERTFEGRFIRRGDAEKLMLLLRENCSCYMDLRMDMA